MRTVKLLAVTVLGLALLVVLGLPAFSAVAGPFFHFGHLFDGKWALEVGEEEIASYFKGDPTIEEGEIYLRSKGFDCSTGTISHLKDGGLLDADAILCSYSHGLVLGSGWLWLVTVVYDAEGNVAGVHSEDKLAMAPAVIVD